MKILALASALFLIILAGTAFAAWLYWGQPYMGVNHHQGGHFGSGESYQAFGGCPYLEKLHEGIEAPLGEDGLNFHPWQEPSFGPQDKKNNDVIVI